MYRNFRTPSIWREMEQFQRDMNRLFNGYFSSRVRPASIYPAVNIWANEEGQIITTEMPGIHTDDIEINVSADTLTLSGTRNPETIADTASYHRRERNYGKFSRTIQLPFMADSSKVEAEFDNGILRITLPRAEADKPRKIAIKGE